MTTDLPAKMQSSQVVIAAVARLAAVSQLGTALGANIAGGSFNRIQLRSGAMRLVQNGSPVSGWQRDINVVIVGASEALERVWYHSTFDPANQDEKPDCTSANGITPNAGTETTRPKVGGKPVVSCATCPMNAPNSGAGGRGKACSMGKRILVVAPDDIGGPVYTFRASAMSIFKDGGGNVMSLQQYAKYLNPTPPRAAFPNGILPSSVITNISMDMEETVAVSRFSVVDFLAPAAQQEAYDRSNSDEIKRLISLTVMSNGNEPDAGEATAGETVTAIINAAGSPTAEGSATERSWREVLALPEIESAFVEWASESSDADVEAALREDYAELFARPVEPAKPVARVGRPKKSEPRVDTAVAKPVAAEVATSAPSEISMDMDELNKLLDM